jgi:UPF0052 protein yvcK
MNKKVVILGGGTGMSTLLKGLKQFPIDITAIVSVCDDGQSTGRLREEFNIVAVGDIRKVLVSLSETEPLVKELLNYRFQTTSDLNGHTVGNLILTALTNITGNLSDGIESLSKVFNLKGKVLPLTEDNVTLVAEMDDHKIVEGEHHITESKGKIKHIFYKEEPIVNPLVLKAIEEADLIIFSMGSLYTSILPNLICKEVIQALDSSDKKMMYVSNMMTQPGETDRFKVSDHVKVLNQYLGTHKVNVVVANDGEIKEEVARKYETLEEKDQVILDRDELQQMNVEVIENDYVTIENDIIRHQVDKLALDIYSYLINKVD